MGCTHLIPFAECIYALEFKEEPNYDKLRFLLKTELLNVGMVPNNQYDWNQGLVIRRINDSHISDESFQHSLVLLDEYHKYPLKRHQ